VLLNERLKHSQENVNTFPCRCFIFYGEISLWPVVFLLRPVKSQKHPPILFKTAVGHARQSCVRRARRNDENQKTRLIATIPDKINEILFFTDP